MTDTLRLLMPQWQGGNNPAYAFGARLLAWLAPGADTTTVQAEVPVEVENGRELLPENGVVAQSVLLRQLRSAAKIIDAYQPERIVVFGGDCLVAQAPFAYLNGLYGGKLGVLWLDAYPDISNPGMFGHEHAMVLGNLLGEGDPKFAAEVKIPLRPELVMYGGLCAASAQETEIIKRLQLRKATAAELAVDSAPILEWLHANQIERLAIHLDLDVLDPRFFRALLFAQPDGTVIDAPHGEMTLQQIARIIGDISRETDVVGLAIAEHLPWDALNLHNFLAELPILKR